MQIDYLEIVTPDVDATCRVLAALHGVSFSAPVAELGAARIAQRVDGGRLGVRAPMGAAETPIVRPYMLVDDIDAASARAEEAGAVFAMPKTEIPGHGKFAIYLLGGVQHALWER